MALLIGLCIGFVAGYATAKRRELRAWIEMIDRDRPAA